MPLSNDALNTVPGDDTSPSSNLLSQVTPSAPWLIAEAPWEKWALMADDALAREDQSVAEEMIQFAYWSAERIIILPEDEF